MCWNMEHVSLGAAWLSCSIWPIADPRTHGISARGMLFWQCFCRFNAILASLPLTLWPQLWTSAGPSLSFCSSSFCCILPCYPQPWVMGFVFSGKGLTKLLLRSPSSLPLPHVAYFGSQSWGASSFKVLFYYLILFPEVFWELEAVIPFA